MTLGELKPLLTALALPPAGPLLLVLLGLALAGRGRRARPGRRAGSGPGLLLALAGVALLWLLSCQAVAVWLSHKALPQMAPLPAQPAQALRAAGVQAVVVIGGGVRRLSPEYVAPQPNAHTAVRLQYGMHLARASGLPLAFAGGVGWGAVGLAGQPTEAEAAAAFVQDGGLRLRWLDAQSRDTQENAQRLAERMQPQGVRRIALVTEAWHLPRAVRHFERAGFEVLPAPTAFVQAQERPLLQWLPSAQGLSDSRRVLREWLALRVQ